MPPTPDADTDDSTDQPVIDPDAQPGTTDSGDDASTAPDTGEAEGPTQPSESEPFPPHGTLTLRALRWGGLLGAVMFGVTTLVLLLGFPDFGDPTPIMVILTTGPLLSEGSWSGCSSG